MMLSIANPIYDSVFKYLMEDERIAKTILSALLKKEVVQVETRPHEYSNETRDNKIAMFRIDFAAHVKEKDGSIKLVLVELQKTWVETETLRFRRYLAAQYNNKNNMQDNGKGTYALPTVAVYLLGHRVGDIEESVVYFNHKAYNYYGEEVTKGIPDPFVESLSHDSIIVQIPLLRGQVNNRLEKVLSVFDQTKADNIDKQVIQIDEQAFAGDDDMNYIVRRLTAAAADHKMREDMNVEDEYYSAIENRDTAIMNRDKRIKEQDRHIAEQELHIAEQDHHIAEQDHHIAKQGQQIAEQGQQLAEQGQQLKSMAMALRQSGMSEEAIAKATGMSVEKVRELLS